MKTGDHTLRVDSRRGGGQAESFGGKCSCEQWRTLRVWPTRGEVRDLHREHFDEVNAAEQAARDPEIQLTMPVPSGDQHG